MKQRVVDFRPAFARGGGVPPSDLVDRVDPRRHPAVAGALASDIFRHALAKEFREHLLRSADLVDEPELRAADVGRRLVASVLGDDPSGAIGSGEVGAPDIELRIDWRGRSHHVGPGLLDGPLAGLYGVCASFVEDGLDGPTIEEWLDRLDRVVRRCASEGRQDAALQACAAFLCLQAEEFPRGALPILVLRLLRALREEGGGEVISARRLRRGTGVASPARPSSGA